MAINKATLAKEADGYIEYIYPKTTADIVEYDIDTNTSVKDAIDNLNSTLVALTSVDSSEITDTALSNEIIAARANGENVAEATLKNRLDNDYKELSKMKPEIEANAKAIDNISIMSNLINPQNPDLQPGYSISTDGTLNVSNNGIVTNYIDISNYDYFSVLYAKPTNIAFYDSEKNYITREAGNSAKTNYTYYKNNYVNNNIEPFYIRLTYTLENFSNAMVTFSDDLSLEFIPYGKRYIRSESIPELAAILDNVNDINNIFDSSKSYNLLNIDDLANEKTLSSTGTMVDLSELSGNSCATTNFIKIDVYNTRYLFVRYEIPSYITLYSSSFTFIKRLSYDFDDENGVRNYSLDTAIDLKDNSIPGMVAYIKLSYNKSTEEMLTSKAMVYLSTLAADKYREYINYHDRFIKPSAIDNIDELVKMQNSIQLDRKNKLCADNGYSRALNNNQTYSSYAPSGSIPAFKKAIELKTDFICINNIQCSSDGVYYILQQEEDPNNPTITTASIDISQNTSTSIDNMGITLQYGESFGIITGEWNESDLYIPKLEEVLALCSSNNINIIIDLSFLPDNIDTLENKTKWTNFINFCISHKLKNSIFKANHDRIVILHSYQPNWFMLYDAKATIGITDAVALSNVVSLNYNRIGIMFKTITSAATSNLVEKARKNNIFIATNYSGTFTDAYKNMAIDIIFTTRDITEINELKSDNNILNTIKKNHDDIMNIIANGHVNRNLEGSIFNEETQQNEQFVFEVSTRSNGEIIAISGGNEVLETSHTIGEHIIPYVDEKISSTESTMLNLKDVIGSLENKLLTTNMTINNLMPSININNWSNETKLYLDEPRIARINIVSDSIPTTKTDDVVAIMEFYDMDGNYFKKYIILNAQGQSSLAFRKKNFSFDMYNSLGTDNNEFKLKIGNWVEQDSFHLKAYYTDFFRGISNVCYQLYNQVNTDRGMLKDRPWKKALVEQKSITTKSSEDGVNYADGLNVQLDNGAKCFPMGFPCELYFNGSFYGIYSFNLKKHRDNMNMKKNKAKHIHLDGKINPMTLFSNPYIKYPEGEEPEITDQTVLADNINWDPVNAVEIRNPKKLVYVKYVSTSTIGDLNIKKYQNRLCDIVDFGEYDADYPDRQKLLSEDLLVPDVSGKLKFDINALLDKITDPTISTRLRNTYNNKSEKEKKFIRDNAANTAETAKHIRRLSRMISRFKQAEDDIIERYGLRGENDYLKDANGNFLLDASGNRIPSDIPLNKFSKSAIEEMQELIKLYLSPRNVIDYVLFATVIGDADAFSKNWQWATYDGKKWYINPYDLDCVFGANARGNTLTATKSITDLTKLTFLGDSKEIPTGWVIKYFPDKLKARWNELHDKGIFKTKNIMKLIKKWCNRIGQQNFEREYEKWPESPCNRDSKVNSIFWIGPTRVLEQWKYNTGYDVGNCVAYTMPGGVISTAYSNEVENINSDIETTIINGVEVEVSRNKVRNITTKNIKGYRCINKYYKPSEGDVGPRPLLNSLEFCVWLQRFLNEYITAKTQYDQNNNVQILDDFIKKYNLYYYYDSSAENIDDRVKKIDDYIYGDNNENNSGAIAQWYSIARDNQGNRIPMNVNGFLALDFTDTNIQNTYIFWENITYDKNKRYTCHAGYIRTNNPNNQNYQNYSEYKNYYGNYENKDEAPCEISETTGYLVLKQANINSQDENIRKIKYDEDPVTHELKVIHFNYWINVAYASDINPEGLEANEAENGSVLMFTLRANINPADDTENTYTSIREENGVIVGGIKGISPLKSLYSSYPYEGGHKDNIYRIYKWIKANIKFIDNRVNGIMTEDRTDRDNNIYI